MTLELDKSGWKRTTLGAVAKASKERVDPQDGTVSRYVAGDHMDTDDLKIHRWGEIGDGYLGPAFHRRFRPGQVLYGSRRTYLRKVAVAHFDGVTANTTFVVETQDPSLLLQDFLPFIMTSEPFHGFSIRESKGSVNPYVNWSDIERFEFDLPPVDEQRRLADLFWAFERYRRAIPLKELHTVEARLFGEIVLASSGTLRRLDSVGSVLMGRQRSPKHAVGKNVVPYLRVANVGEGQLKLDDVKMMNFTPDEQNVYGVLPDDILISEGQSRELVGQSVLVVELPEPMCFQNTLIRFRPDSSLIRPKYAQALFRACLRAGIFSSLATQTTSIAHLGVTRFAKLELPIPDVSQQDVFLRRLAACQDAIATAQAEVAALILAKSVLVAEAFGGNK